MREHLPVYDRLQDALAAASRGIEVKRILDLGVGTGETAWRCLAEHPGAQLVAIDASERMIEIAAAVLPGASLRLARMEDPLPDGPFELVVSALAVHHVIDKRGLFARIRAVLADGGRFLIADVIDAPVAHPAPLDPAVDHPVALEELVESMTAAGLDPKVLWVEDDLALLSG